MRKRHVFMINMLVIVCVGWAFWAMAAEYDPIVEKAQKRLTELGYASVPIDGLWGKKTELAVEKFQQDQDLPVTGKLDQETQEKLGIRDTTEAQKESTPEQVEKPDSTPETQQPGSEAKQVAKPEPDPETDQPTSGPRQSKEITISGKDWDFTVYSIENTGKQEWTDTYRGQIYVKDKSQSFWKLNIDTRYKKKGMATFSIKWVKIIYTTLAGESHESEIIGQTSTDGSSTFGASSISITPPIDAGDNHVIKLAISDFLFLAPKDTEEITSMTVKFREYPEVQISLQDIKSSQVGK